MGVELSTGNVTPQSLSGFVFGTSNSNFSSETLFLDQY